MIARTEIGEFKNHQDAVHSAKATEGMCVALEEIAETLRTQGCTAQQIEHEFLKVIDSLTDLKVPFQVKEVALRLAGKDQPNSVI